MHTTSLINEVLLPVKLFVPQNIINRIPWLTTNEDIRIQKTLANIQGRLLDIGCGKNRLVKEYLAIGGKGDGVDAFDWGEKDVTIVENLAKLPFNSCRYDTVTIIACLNYFVNREQVLKEAHRVLKENGKIILTMVSPHLMKIWNAYKFWDRGVNHIGKIKGEEYGFTKKQMISLLAENGFKIERIHGFSWGLNYLYIAGKTSGDDV